jgi:hypothetical protein
MDPQFANGRIRAGTEMADVEASHYALLIALLTGVCGGPACANAQRVACKHELKGGGRADIRAPRLMASYEHLLLDDAHVAVTTEIFRGFQKNLTALADEIDLRNDRRKWRYNGFNPRRLLSSVSV